MFYVHVVGTHIQRTVQKSKEHQNENKKRERKKLKGWQEGYKIYKRIKVRNKKIRLEKKWSEDKSRYLLQPGKREFHDSNLHLIYRVWSNDAWYFAVFV